MDDQAWRKAQAEWEDPANWRTFGIYVAPRDPRVWVRKRNPVRGWTLNFAHSRSWVWVAGLAILVAGVIAIRVANE